MFNVDMLRNRHCKVAYLSSDHLVDEATQTGAGGLGVVAGSMRLTLEKLGIDSVFIGTYASHGYGTQFVTPEGRMVPRYVRDPNPENVTDTGLRFTLVLHGVECHVAVRTPARISQKHAIVLLLDTDIPENTEAMRLITAGLYGEGRLTEQLSSRHESWRDIAWMRVLQAAVLGLGSYYAMRLLGITADFVHVNDSHPVFHLVHMHGMYVREGMNHEQALVRVHETTRYTCHTVLESGNPKYSIEKTIVPICGHYAGFDLETLRKIAGDDDVFRMTTGALTLVGSGHANGVSKDHARIASGTFGYPLIPITNGVARELYQHPRFAELTRPEDIPTIKRAIAEETFRMLDDRARNAGWEPRNVHVRDWSDAVLIVLARRIQEYKRAGLMWHHVQFDGMVRLWLEWRWISVAWGGLTHPDDRGMNDLWNEYFARIRDVSNVMPVFNYRMDLMLWLKAAARIWLNLPWYGYEACGTSWMSAMMNCALVVSIPDGGVIEARNVVLFGSNQSGEWNDQYESDATALWKILAPLVCKMRENDPTLLRMIYEAKLEAETEYSADRMVRDYLELLWK